MIFSIFSGKREHIYDVVLLIGLKLTKFWETLVYITMFYIIFSFTHVIPKHYHLFVAHLAHVECVCVFVGHV